MLKKILVFLLTALILNWLQGCDAAPNLTGTWTCTTEASLLGVGITQPTTEETQITFVFNDDGTGTQSTAVGDRPEISFAFTYTTDGDTLTLTMENGSQDSCTYRLTDTTLTLETPRITLELTRE